MSVNNGRDPDPAVSVVVPVRNEAGNIGPLVAEIETALAAQNFEIVYINDGSTDATEAELLSLMAERPHLRQIQPPHILRPVGRHSYGRTERARRHRCDA